LTIRERESKRIGKRQTSRWPTKKKRKKDRPSQMGSLKKKKGTNTRRGTIKRGSHPEPDLTAQNRNTDNEASEIMVGERTDTEHGIPVFGRLNGNSVR